MTQPRPQSTRISAEEARLTYCLLAYHFPPDTTAGAVRAYGLARALADAGNTVHVFTRGSGPSEPEGYCVHAVPGRLPGQRLKTAVGLPATESFYARLRGLSSSAVRRLARFGREWFIFPDSMRSWSKGCAAEVASWLAKNRCDVVISTALPASTHMAALRALGGKPGSGPIWILDWRDLLVANPLYPFGRIRRWRDRRLERALMARADVVTVVTEAMGRSLAEAYPRARIVPVYNGYDERTVAEHERRAHDDARLTFTHAGYLYEGNRSARPLLASLAGLISGGHVDRTRVSLRFVGPHDEALLLAVEELGLTDVVELLGVAPRPVVHKMLVESDVLIIIQWNPILEASLIPSKAFEYIAARRPILALNCSPDGELGCLLRRTRTGICVVGEQEIGAAVLELYRRFICQGPAEVDSDQEAVGYYTHERMASEFDALARSLLGGASIDT